MGLQGPYRTQCPDTLYAVSGVMQLNDYERSTRDRPVQARDEDGRPLWVIEIMDADPDAREKLFKVKIAAEREPVPPVGDGSPFLPIMLENLTVTPWLNDKGMRPKIQLSLRCTGLAERKTGPSTVRTAGMSGSTAPKVA